MSDFLRSGFRQLKHNGPILVMIKVKSHQSNQECKNACIINQTGNIMSERWTRRWQQSYTSDICYLTSAWMRGNYDDLSLDLFHRHFSTPPPHKKNTK